MFLSVIQPSTARSEQSWKDAVHAVPWSDQMVLKLSKICQGILEKTPLCSHVWSTAQGNELSPWNLAVCDLLQVPDAWSIWDGSVGHAGMSLHLPAQHCSPPGRKRRNMGTPVPWRGRHRAQGQCPGWGAPGTQHSCRHSHPGTIQPSHHTPCSSISCPLDWNSLHKPPSKPENVPSSLAQPGKRLALSKRHGMSRLTINHKNLVPSCWWAEAAPSSSLLWLTDLHHTVPAAAGWVQRRELAL